MYLQGSFGMKAHLIDTHLLVPRSMSDICWYQGHLHICWYQGQCQISRSHFLINGRFWGITVSQTLLVLSHAFNAFKLIKSKMLSSVNSTTQSRLLTTLRKWLLKTFWEKEKMLGTIFSFSQNVSYHSKTNFSFLVGIYFVVCKTGLKFCRLVKL